MEDNLIFQEICKKIQELIIPIKEIKIITTENRYLNENKVIQSKRIQELEQKGAFSQISVKRIPYLSAENFENSLRYTIIPIEEKTLQDRGTAQSSNQSFKIEGLIQVSDRNKLSPAGTIMYERNYDRKESLGDWLSKYNNLTRISFRDNKHNSFFTIEHTVIGEYDLTEEGDGWEKESFMINNVQINYELFKKYENIIIQLRLI